MNFNFQSKACTTPNQSQKLIKLGLNEKTADCYNRKEEGYYINMIGKPSLKTDIPAWSSARLFEMIPKSFREDDRIFYLNIYTDADGYDFEYESNVVDYECDDYDEDTISLGYGYGYDVELYEALIETIEILIKRNHFPQEYLKKKKNNSVLYKFKCGDKVKNIKTNKEYTIVKVTDKTYMFNDNEYIFDDEDGFSHTDSDKFILIR